MYDPRDTFGKRFSICRKRRRKHYIRLQMQGDAIMCQYPNRNATKRLMAKKCIGCYIVLRISHMLGYSMGVKQCEGVAINIANDV